MPPKYSERHSIQQACAEHRPEGLGLFRQGRLNGCAGNVLATSLSAGNYATAAFVRLPIACRFLQLVVLFVTIVLEPAFGAIQVSDQDMRNKIDADAGEYGG